MKPVPKNGASERGRAIDFLGYVLTRENCRLRKRTKKRMFARTAKLKSKTKLKQRLAAYYGWCKHGKCRHLWKKILIKTSSMGFKSKGVSTQGNTTSDGHKFFDCKQMSLMDLLNTPITVIDFENGVKTKLGEDRCCVLIALPDGSQRKFITTSIQLRATLDAARKAEIESGRKIFPVDNVIIKRKSLGDGKATFYFDE